MLQKATLTMPHLDRNTLLDIRVAELDSHLELLFILT